MRHATRAEGPLTVVLKGQDVPLRAAYIDGGGLPFWEHPSKPVGVYEVHGQLLDGGSLCVPQDQIERVLDAKGVEVEFGNPYLPGHPRPQCQRVVDYLLEGMEPAVAVTMACDPLDDDPCPCCRARWGAA